MKVVSRIGSRKHTVLKNWRLAGARAEKGLSYKALAEAVGRSSHYVSAIELLLTPGRRDVRENIAKVLDQPVDYLFPDTIVIASRGKQDVYSRLERDKRINAAYRNIPVEYDNEVEETEFRQKVNERLGWMLQELPDSEKKNIEDYYFKGLTQEEIGKRRRRTTQSVSASLASALEKLRLLARLKKLDNLYYDK